MTFLVTGNDEPGSAGPIQITAINGQSLVAGDTIAVSHGSVTLNADGTLTITPELNYAGDIGFAYTVTDQAGQSANSTVQVQVEAINDAPLVSGGTLVDVNTAEDAPVSGKVNATDPEDDALTFTQGTGPAHGSATVNGDGTWTYTPKPDFNGKDSFTVTVSDGNGGSTEVTIRVDVADVPDAPASAPQRSHVRRRLWQLQRHNQRRPASQWASDSAGSGRRPGDFRKGIRPHTWQRHRQPGWQLDLYPSQRLQRPRFVHGDRVG